jgi:hypothetical protein
MRIATYNVSLGLQPAVNSYGQTVGGCGVTYLVDPDRLASEY